jgi:GTP pyrophosphokinase
LKGPERGSGSSNSPEEKVPQEGSKALRLLRDSFLGRIEESQRVASVKLAWQELWGKASRYLSKEELTRLGEAMVVASKAHEQQKRSSGEPYIVHTISVASILADMELDVDTLVAALLHDVLEDTDLSGDTIRSAFGENVLLMVDGVTKLGKLPFNSFEDYQAQNLRKMFLVMAKDIRVVLIKLADRLHNMRTIQTLRRDKQVRIAKETVEIYAPLAHRLGIYQIKRDLEDLSFKVLDPEMFYEIRRRVRKKLPEREQIIKQAIDILNQKMKEIGIEVSITGRAKHFFSIYEKMQRKNLSLEQLYDLLALRVIVGTVAECYSVLGIVHTIWKPIPGQFDDYIANPKSNMYQSLHTTVIGPSGEPLEIQIRTREMHWLAEYGIAAHWHYKEPGTRLNEMDKRLAWVRQALEGQGETPTEFMENLKGDVLTSEVFAFTPNGDVVSLPAGSTPLDFAYMIHTEVGNKYVGAMVNGKIVPIDYEIQNGEIVRILTSPQGKPSRDWLKIARSSKARSKIRAYFRQIERTEREERAVKGRELLERELRRREPGLEWNLQAMAGALNRVAHDLGYSSGEDLIAAVGGNSQSASTVAMKLLETTRVAPQQEVPLEASQAAATPAMARKEFDTEIVVEGAGGVLVSLANCCCPVPGDAIVGYVTKTRGITIHRSDCRNIEEAKSERAVRVEWGRLISDRYTARLKLEGMDRAGLFADVSQAISSMDGNIIGVKASVVAANRARMTIEIRVRDVEHLYRIMAKLNTVNGIIGVFRG